MITSTTFARRVFGVAGIYGAVVLVPLYFLEGRLNQGFPPPMTHPEHFYGFIGVALAWQAVFLLIAHDVSRYRPLMLPAILEKLAFGGPAVILFATDRVGAAVLTMGLIDLTIGTAFAAAYLATRTEAVAPAP